MSNLVAGGTQTPFQTGSTAVGSVKPMVVSGPTANYPTGSVMVFFRMFLDRETEKEIDGKERGRSERTREREKKKKTNSIFSHFSKKKKKKNRTMYLLTTQTSTTLRLLAYTNTGNLASNTAPILASQRTVTSSISIGGAGSYGNAQLASGTQFEGGDDRLIGLSYANGRMLASCTSYYGSTAASPKVSFEKKKKR